MTLIDQLTAAARTSPHAVGLTGPDAALSHADITARSGAVARALHAQGIGPGDRIIYLGYNTAALIVLIFAAARLNCIVSPLNWRLARDELRWMVENAEPSLMVCDPSHEDIAAAIRGGVPLVTCAALLDAPPRDAPDITPDADAPLLLVYTSGATGRPKGALLTQRALSANAALSVDMHTMTPDDHVLTALPLFHVGGLNIQTLPALLIGARVTLLDRFEPGACIAAIRHDRPSLSVQVPATLSAMIAHPDWASLDLSCLRAIATGSTDVPVPLIEQLHARGVPVIQIYGATETGPVVVYQHIEEARSHLGSIGRPGPGVSVSIRDTNGNPVSRGDVGEIWLRSPTLAARYWRNPEADSAFAQGWFRTGDMARQGEGGFLWFADRLKNVIISGGENIFPAELERILAAIPDIQESAVVGRADPRWGAVPVAVVVGSATREQILAAFNGRLARFKHPKDVIHVDALPRNAMGKIETPALRALVNASS